MSAESRDVADVLDALIVDHSMWIGDDGEPLDYLPKREARIAAFVREAKAALVPLVDQARTEAWPCANYRAPATCLTVPSSETGRCDWCKGVADQIRAQERERIAQVIQGHYMQPDPDTKDAFSSAFLNAFNEGLRTAANIAREVGTR